MNITVGKTVFDNVAYDRADDVLYLHVGDPGTAVDFDELPEGHTLRYDAADRLVGITIVNAKRLLDRDGRVTVTAGEPISVDRAAPAAAIGAA
jgi:YD repeat-containing protein